MIGPQNVVRELCWEAGGGIERSTWFRPALKGAARRAEALPMALALLPFLVPGSGLQRSPQAELTAGFGQ